MIKLLKQLYAKLFSNRYDEYPITKKKSQSRTDQVADPCKYDEIINDYPTYHRQEGVK